VASDAVPLRSPAIGEDREVTGRLFQSGELKLRIAAGPLVALRLERGGVASREIPPDRGADRLVVDDDKTPGLAQSHRRGEACRLDEGFKRAARQWIAAEAPDIPAPDQKIAQAAAKSIVERG